MMKRASRVSFVTSCCLAAAFLCSSEVPAAAEAEEWLLRLKPQDRTKYRFEMLQEQQVRMEMAAMGSQEVNGTTRLEFSQWLEGTTEEGNLRLGWAYDRVVMRMNAAGQEIVFDSAESAEGGGQDGGLSEMWELMLGRELVVEFSPRGEVLAVEGLSELMDAAFGEIGNEPEAQQLAQLLKQSFGDEQMHSMMQMSFTVLPEAPVKVGDVWRHDQAIRNAALGEIQSKNQYTATGLGGAKGAPCLEAAVETTITFDAAEAQLFKQMSEMFRQQGTELSVEFDISDAEMSGTSCIDVATGLMTTSDMNMRMAMTMKMQAGGESQDGDGAIGQNFEMDMAIDQNIQVRPLGVQFMSGD